MNQLIRHDAWQIARQVIFDARSNPEWQRLNFLAEDGDQDALDAMSELYHREVDRLIDTYPEDVREDVAANVGELLARMCGAI